MTIPRRRAISCPANLCLGTHVTPLLPTHGLRFLLLNLIIWPCLADSASLESRWQAMLTEVTGPDTHPVVAAEDWNRFDPRLLNPENQYPDLERFSWEDLERLRRLRIECRSPTGVPARLQRAITFELALCEREALPLAWFESGERLHPAGGSYADRYVQAWQERSIQGESIASELIDAGANLLSLAHPAHPLANPLDGISDAGLVRLRHPGTPHLETDSGTLWIRTETGFYRIADTRWQPLAKHHGLSLAPVSGRDRCALEHGNLCIEPRQPMLDLTTISLATLLALSLAWILRLSWQRLQAARERRFILQLLTHELRTPIASLALTVEQFRAGFDQLGKPGQQAFGRLLEDHQRLRQVVRGSHGYLEQDTEAFAVPQQARLSDWLDHVTRDPALIYCLETDDEWTLPYYWLGICLDNLIRNALEHGTGPVRLTVRTGRRLELEVSDAGSGPARANRRRRGGRGQGLMLVRRIMKRLGGRLTHQRHPTRYTLEIPLR